MTRILWSSYLCLLRGAHPLVPVASWGMGMAVFLRRYDLQRQIGH